MLGKLNIGLAAALPIRYMRACMHVDETDY